MASEISVERQFRFHCSCGATIVTGERTVTCTACGITLGVRRVRRHRQHGRDSIAYYGSTSTHTLPRPASSAIPSTPSRPSWTLPVRRLEKRRRDSNTEAAIPSPGIRSRLGAWLKSELADWGKVLKDSGAEKHVDAQGMLFDIGTPSGGNRSSSIPDEPRGLPVVNEQQSRQPSCEGMWVQVGPTRPDGKPHPHAGKTGRITKLIEACSKPYRHTIPSAMVKLDHGFRLWPGRFILVSLECLAALPENARDADS
jgi:hypothetical protein